MIRAFIRLIMVAAGAWGIYQAVKVNRTAATPEDYRRTGWCAVCGTELRASAEPNISECPECNV